MLLLNQTVQICVFSSSELGFVLHKAIYICPFLPTQTLRLAAAERAYHDKVVACGCISSEQAFESFLIV